MQNAKDSFYEVMRQRLASVNPERTISVRGISRPALVVDENEMESSSAMPDCFHLRWTEAKMDCSGALPLVTLTCEISYVTAGSTMNGGLDRGRALAAMDAELLRMVQAEPQNAVKMAWSSGATDATNTPMSTRVWWSDLVAGPLKVNRNQLTRTATVQVMSFEEDGEL